MREGGAPARALPGGIKLEAPAKRGYAGATTPKTSNKLQEGQATAAAVLTQSEASSETPSATRTLETSRESTATCTVKAFQLVPAARIGMIKWLWERSAARTTPATPVLSDPQAERRRVYAYYRGTTDALVRDFYGVKSRVKHLARQGLLIKQIVGDGKGKTWAEYRALTWCEYWCIPDHAGGQAGTVLCERGTDGTVNTAQECTATFGDVAADRARELATLSSGYRDTLDRLEVRSPDQVTGRVVIQAARAGNGVELARPRIRATWEQSQMEPTWLAGGEIYTEDSRREPTAAQNPRVQELSVEELPGDKTEETYETRATRRQACGTSGECRSGVQEARLRKWTRSALRRAK